MRLSAIAFCMILTTIFLSGCGKTEMAALDDHGGSYYGRNGVMSLASAAIYTAPTVQEAPTMSVASSDLAAPGAATAATAWQWPVNGTVTEKFGSKTEAGANEGIVIAAAEGAPIKAVQAGEVAYVGNDAKTYGNIVILRHGDGDLTSYSHAKEIIVAKGQKVAAGATLGYVGMSGKAAAPQLHFAVRENGASIDPLTKLPAQVAMK